MTRTLASLALLKTIWDIDQKDFIDIFILLIITLFNKNRYEFVDTDNLSICKDFEAEFGFSIPYHPMITVLKRAKKLGYFDRKYGRFYPIWEKIEHDDISKAVEEQEIKYQHVIEEFLKFCANEYNETITKEDAEKSFVSFLKDHDLDILFAAKEGTTILPSVNTPTEHKFLMFNFITYAIDNNLLVFSFIVAISIGHIIANTMLIRDYSQIQGNLKNAKIYLDTDFLFGVTGSNGISMKEAYSEWVNLAQSQGASLYIFRHTYREFLNILEGCLRYIEDPSYNPQKANRALLNFRDRDWSASDVEEFIIHIDKTLSSLGISIMESLSPMKDMEYQINEKKLEEIIIDNYKSHNPHFSEEEKGESIYQDVKSITYVYKLRRGHIPRTLAQVQHIFVTTNSALAHASREYEHLESNNDLHYIPAVLTDVFLGTLLWIRSPSKSQINEKRLAALAYAASMPSGLFREKIVTTAKALQKRDSISADDVVLLTESRAARNLLQRKTLGNPDKLSEEIIIKTVEQTRLEIREEEMESFNAERYTYQERLQDAERKTYEVEEEKRKAEELASRQWKELNKIKKNLDNQAQRRVDGILWLCFAIYIVISIFLVRTILHFGWQVVEPYLYLLGILLTSIPPLYFLITKEECGYTEISAKMAHSCQIKLYSESGLDLEEFEKSSPDTGGTNN